MLPDDFFQQVDVISEGFAAGRRKRAGRERAIILIRLGHGNVAFLLQGFDVRGEIAVGHFQRIAQLREGQFWRGGEHGHDGQAAFFMDDPIQL